MFQIVSKRKPTIPIAAALLAPNIFGHNIDLGKAREVAREYARIVRQGSNGKYLHYATNCVEAFPGHNHYVRCIVQFQNAKDEKAGVWSCTEKVEVYFVPHNHSLENFTYFTKHTSSNTCGTKRIEKVLNPYEK